MNKLIAYRIAFLSYKGTDANMTPPIEEMWEASVWETDSDGSTTLSAQQCPLNYDPPVLKYPHMAPTVLMGAPALWFLPRLTE